MLYMCVCVCLYTHICLCHRWKVTGVLTVKAFHRSLFSCIEIIRSHPLVQQIRNYTIADLTNLHKKYKHKRTKHILLKLAYRKSLCFCLFIIFHCRYLHLYIYIYIYIYIILQFHLYHSVNVY